MIGVIKIPNHITNQLTFGSDAAALEAFHRMLEDLRVDGGQLGSLDFNKLIPMPEDLNIESGTRTDAGLRAYRAYLEGDAGAERLKSTDSETWELGRRAYENLQKYGTPTWYAWCSANWGTKWNAYDSVRLDKKADTMYFHTAWDGVPKLVQEISRRCPAQTVTYRWADENIGSNVGEVTFRNGEIVAAHIPENGTREARKLAQRIRAEAADAAARERKRSEKGRDAR